MNVTKGIKQIPLTFWTCYFLDSEDGLYPTTKPNLMFKCRSQGRYLSGTSSEEESHGRIICIFLCAVIYLIGMFGFLTNIINILVLRKSLKGSSLKNLLIFLAIFELVACVFSMMFSTMIIVILENASRNEVAFYFFKIGHILYSFGRTGAIYISILVTIERYLVVAFPIRSKTWLTHQKSVCYLVGVILFAIVQDLPWIFNTVVAKNDVSLSPDTSLHEFPYIFKGTDFAKNVYSKIRYPHLILNYVAPFPLLLVFNGLLYRSIHNWNQSRQHLTRTQKKEIGAARMFSVVVLVLLLCHTVSCVIVFLAQFQKAIYRELMFLQVLSVALSAAINFIVYLQFGKAFRVEFRKLMVTWVSLGRRQYVPEKDAGPPSTQSTDR